MPLDYSALVAKWLAETDTDALFRFVVNEATTQNPVARDAIYEALRGYSLVKIPVKIPAVAQIAQG